MRVHVNICWCFSGPAGLCSLHLNNLNSSSVSVNWDSAIGEFDFHRVTVANTSITNTLIIPKEERVAVVTGLVDGCSYNVSAERVRGETAGSAAVLTVTTGRQHFKGCTGQNIMIPRLLIKIIKTDTLSSSLSPFLPFLSFMSAGPCERIAFCKSVCTFILAAVGAGTRVCGSL